MQSVALDGRTIIRGLVPFMKPRFLFSNNFASNEHLEYFQHGKKSYV